MIRSLDVANPFFYPSALQCKINRGQEEKITCTSLYECFFFRSLFSRLLMQNQINQPEKGFLHHCLLEMVLPYWLLWALTSAVQIELFEDQCKELKDEGQHF